METKGRVMGFPLEISSYRHVIQLTTNSCVPEEVFVITRSALNVSAVSREVNTCYERGVTRTPTDSIVFAILFAHLIDINVVISGAERQKPAIG